MQGSNTQVFDRPELPFLAVHDFCDAAEDFRQLRRRRVRPCEAQHTVAGHGGGATSIGSSKLIVLELCACAIANGAADDSLWPHNVAPS